MADQCNNYDLQSCGIKKTIHILGDLQVLLPSAYAPVVFLIDERHADDCINQNLQNAKELAEHCEILFAGVESGYGGWEWDDLNHIYTKKFNAGSNAIGANKCPQFAQSLEKLGVLPLGVECQGLANELECDLADNPNGGMVRDRPYNLKRSEHFIRTIFQLRKGLARNGNVILNVGGDHNTHIAEWVRNGSIQLKTGCKAAYVRLRAPAY